MEGGVSVLGLELLGRLDLKCFDQDELLWMSQAASARFRDIRCELVIPAIDRAMFNESASSKKQTYNMAAFEEGEDRKVDLAEEAAVSKRLVEMRGTWVSAQKREKIIGAQGFPDGWTVTVGLSYRDGRCFLSFRNYASPDGHSWPTFKAAASFLGRSFAAGQKSLPPEEKHPEGNEAVEQVEMINVESDGSRDEGASNPQVVIDKQQQQSEEQQKSNHQVQSEVQLQSQSQSQLKSKSKTEEQAVTTPMNGTPNCFTCDKCGKSFSKKTQYDGHRGTHAKQRTKRKSCPSPAQPPAPAESNKMINPTVPSSSNKTIDPTVPSSSNKTIDPTVPSSNGNSNLSGWLDEGCFICKASVPGIEQLAICNWCENEFHLGCVGGGAQALGSEWICPICTQ